MAFCEIGDDTLPSSRALTSAEAEAIYDAIDAIIEDGNYCSAIKAALQTKLYDGTIRMAIDSTLSTFNAQRQGDMGQQDFDLESGTIVVEYLRYSLPDPYAVARSLLHELLHPYLGFDLADSAHVNGETVGNTINQQAWGCLALFLRADSRPLRQPGRASVPGVIQFRFSARR
jgi:hypothetical protein